MTEATTPAQSVLEFFRLIGENNLALWGSAFEKAKQDPIAFASCVQQAAEIRRDIHATMACAWLFANPDAPYSYVLRDPAEDPLRVVVAIRGIGVYEGKIPFQSSPGPDILEMIHRLAS